MKLLNSNEIFNIIASGTDILIKLHHNKINNANLISIRKIQGLNNITLLEDGTISIGSLVTFTEIIRSDVIKENIPVLIETATSMGGPQIRNMATIGGNICNGAVSADSAPVLFSLNSQLKIKSISGERIISILDFYEGPGKVKIENNEILTEILIDIKDYYGKSSKYIKFTHRKALDISMLGVCIVLNIKENTINDMRVSLGVAGPTPLRCLEAERYSIGKELN